MRAFALFILVTFFAPLGFSQAKQPLPTTEVLAAKAQTAFEAAWKYGKTSGEINPQVLTEHFRDHVITSHYPKKGTNSSNRGDKDFENWYDVLERMNQITDLLNGIVEEAKIGGEQMPTPLFVAAKESDSPHWKTSVVWRVIFQKPITLNGRTEYGIKWVIHFANDGRTDPPGKEGDWKIFGVSRSSITDIKDISPGITPGQPV